MVTTMAKRFQKPTASEVTEYAETIGFALDGEAFVDFYESKGWRIGTAPMKNWQAAVRTWKRRQKTDGTLKASPREQYLKEAIHRTRTIQQYIRSGHEYENTEPREALSRYWTGLRDKHGYAFIDELKKRLKR